MRLMGMPSSSKFVLCALAAAAASALPHSPARAATFMDTLATVGATYNLYTSGDIGQAANPNSWSDVEGKVAAGGSAYLRGYSIAANAPGGVALTVGQNVVFQSGTINGSVAAGGTASFPTTSGGTTVTGTVAAGGGVGTKPTSFSGVATYTSSPINFSATSSDLAQASAFLDSAAAQAQGSIGSATNAYGTLTLTSTSKGIIFFDLTASQLSGLNGLKFDVDPTSTVIINVTGLGAANSGITLSNFGFQGDYQAADTLFNFVDATTLNLSGIGFYGSILAPDAQLNANNGQINGAVMVENFIGSMQLNEKAFTGTLPTAHIPAPPSTAVPEPGTWALLLIGVFGLGAVLRSRRKSVSRIAA